MYKLFVEGLGVVLNTVSLFEAETTYRELVEASNSGMGREAGKNVWMTADGKVVQKHTASSVA